MIDCNIINDLIYIKFQATEKLVRERVFTKPEDAEKFIITHLNSKNNLKILNKLLKEKDNGSR